MPLTKICPMNSKPKLKPPATADGSDWRTMRNIRLKSLFLVVVLSLFGLFPQFVLAQPTEAQKELAEYIRDKYDKREVYITMRDGVKLFTSIYYPEDKSKKYPILLNRTPYTVSPYGKDKEGKDQFKSSLGPDMLFAREG